MPDEAERPVALPKAERRRLRELLVAHGVGLAVIFGSAATTDGPTGDLDIAVEFTEYRPTDDGYAEVYLALYSALEDGLEIEVDLVDVHSMPPEFASVVFEDGVLILGSSDRLATLERRLAGDKPSIEDARARVAAAAGRLSEGSS